MDPIVFNPAAKPEEPQGPQVPNQPQSFVAPAPQTVQPTMPTENPANGMQQPAPSNDLPVQQPATASTPAVPQPAPWQTATSPLGRPLYTPNAAPVSPAPYQQNNLYGQPRYAAPTPGGQPNQPQYAAPTPGGQLNQPYTPAYPTPNPAYPAPVGGMPGQPAYGAQGQPMYGAPQAAQFNPKRPKKGHKKLVFGIVGGLFIALIAAGTVFGYVLPNRPANVWKTGLNRSGKALNQLITNATQKTTLDSFKKSDITATVNAKMTDAEYSGNLTTKFDATAANGSLKITGNADGQPDKTYSVNFMSQLLAGQTLPTMYLQFTGLKVLGADEFLPGISAYDGKWITIDESYLKSLGYEPPAAPAKQRLTTADIAELSRAVASVTTDRFFTTDPQKAVFERRKDLGKEAVDGISAYRYEVGINKAHLTDFCNALIDKVTATTAFKSIPILDTTDPEAVKTNYKKDCANSVKSVKTTDTFDLWIDAKYKLIYKVRLTDTKDKNSYSDIGQKYTGGDDITLFIRGHDAPSKTDGSFNLKTNIKTNLTSADMVVTGNKTDETYKVTINLTAKPYAGTIDVTKPAGAVPVQDVLKTLGFDPLGDGSSGTGSSLPVNVKAKDLERQTDIKAMYAQIEAFWAQNGYYPTLANINDASWRATNMRGLDTEALKDPDGAQAAYAQNATATQYGYVTTNCSAGKCASYFITAILSDNTPYTKVSLNTN